MQPKPHPTAAATEFRRSAEARMHVPDPETGPAQTEADTQRLVHELQVHQIELELQNEELRRARDQVEAGLEKYSDLYEFAPVGYLTLDRDGVIHEANLTSASLLGIERSRLLNGSLGFCVSPADRPVFNRFLEQVFAHRSRQSCEVTILKEGKLPVEVRIEAAVTAAGRECRAAITDITAHKRAERDRFVLSKLESMGILAGGVAHDYSNLLTVIHVNLELARTLIPQGDEFLARRLETAERAALLAQDLTQQFVTIAQGDAPVRLATSLSEIIRAAAEWALSGSVVRCEYSIPENLWPAEVDARQIGQALRNLVLNAREAMPRGGVISVRAENVVRWAEEPPALPPGKYVRVSIIDRGSGIAPEVLPRIFDPYFSTKQRGERRGLGLGLTICHAIIQKHGGAIAVESEVGAGTAFRIHLPACRREPDEEDATAPEIG